LQIAKVVAFCSLTFGLGAMVLAGAVLWLDPGAVPFFGPLVPHWAMHAIGTLLWLVVAGYMTLSSVLGRFRLFGHPIELPGWRMALMQVGLATLDVAVTTSIFYALVPHTHGLSWLRFAGVYLASYSAGLIANLPGGLGVFDGAMLLGLQPWLDAPHVLSAILIFRLFYYIIPLFLAGSLFTGNELLLRGESLWARTHGGLQAACRYRCPQEGG
jgi:glycosyltransferase 2 family protein